MNNIEKQECIICGGKKFKSIIKIDNASPYMQKLLEEKELRLDKKVPLELISCDNCKLCQLKKDSVIWKKYYTDYSWTPISYSKQIQDYQKWLAKDFVNYFNLKGKNAFEVGCGDGTFTLALCKNGLKTVGIEPSKSLYNIANKKIKVFNEYLDKNSSLKKNHYDAFATRQMLEHSDRPNQIIKDIKSHLKPDAVGLIEVPSFLTIVKNNRYSDLFREHVAYYTKKTLHHLLTINNFEVIKIFHSANDEFLTAYFKNNDYYQDDVENFSQNYINYKQKIKELFNKYRNKKVAIWGAGGKGVAFLSMCNIKPEDVLFIIDSDPHKKNKFTPGSHILIKSPQEINFEDIDLIMIAAVMYQKEIIQCLRKKYSYKNKIGLLTPMPHII